MHSMSRRRIETLHHWSMTTKERQLREEAWMYRVADSLIRSVHSTVTIVRWSSFTGNGGHWRAVYLDLFSESVSVSFPPAVWLQEPSAESRASAHKSSAARRLLAPESAASAPHDLSSPMLPQPPGA